MENGRHDSSATFLSIPEMFLLSTPMAQEVQHHWASILEKGKSYAFVGPTGGGKPQLLRLLPRAYMTLWLVRWDFEGKDIRSFQLRRSRTTENRIL